MASADASASAAAIPTPTEEADALGHLKQSIRRQLADAGKQGIGASMSFRELRRSVKQ